MNKEAVNTNLVDQEFWDRTGAALEFGAAPKDHVVREMYEPHIPPGDGDCIEIGCYPGQFLAGFGELGYRLNGVDLIPGTDTALPRWLKSEGFRVGEFSREDFLTYAPGRTFDVVSSFGFIEHFTDWEAILHRHMALVKPGGYLVLSAPNFRGLWQRMFHYLFDRESYRRHNIDSMVPEQWAAILKENGFEILFCGYFGPFHFWVGDQKRSLLSKIPLHIFMDIVFPVLERLPLPKHKKLYSPICGVIAGKVKNG